jgi:hypothetical protein
MMPPSARNISSLPPRKSPEAVTGGRMSSWDGPAQTLMPPHARKISSLPPRKSPEAVTGGRMSSWDGPAQT